jgi:hypothetical protein
VICDPISLRKEKGRKSQTGKSNRPPIHTSISLNEAMSTISSKTTLAHSASTSLHNHQQSRSSTANSTKSDTGYPQIQEITVTTTDKHRQRRNRHHQHQHHRRRRNQSSIHTTIPPIQDRESSLYSRRLNALPTHDWSRSCSDLSIAPILPLSASTRTTSFGSNLDQSISESPTSTPSASSSDINNTLKWCQSTLDLSSITNDWIIELDQHDSGKNSIYSNSEKQSIEGRHRSGSASTYHALKHPSVTFIEPTYPVTSADTSRKWTRRIDKFSKRLGIPKVSIVNKVYHFRPPSFRSYTYTNSRSSRRTIVQPQSRPRPFYCTSSNPSPR